MCEGNHPVNYKGCAIYQEIKRKINPSPKFLKESRTATGSARAEVSSRSFTADKPDVTHQTYAQAAATPKSAPNVSSERSSSNNLEHTVTCFIEKFEKLILQQTQQIGTLMNLLTAVINKLK